MLEPSPSERARTLLEHTRIASLATLTTDFQPLVTNVPYLADGAGHPVMVLTNLEAHVHNAWRHAKAGLLVTDPAGTADVSLMGILEVVPGVQQLDLQDRYLAVHPTAIDRVESLDCSWLRLVVTDVRRGTEPWLDLDDWNNAEPDPLAPVAAHLMDEIRALLEPDLVTLVRAIGGRLRARGVELVAVDRYGIDVMVTEPGGRFPGRIPFGDRIDRPGEVLTRLAFEVRLAHDRNAAAERASDGAPGI